MHQLTCQVTIGEYQFTQVHSLEVESSWDSATDTCRISVPRKLSWLGKPVVGADSLFKKGDLVSVSMGYDFDNHLVFSGFVARIMPGTPLTLECEDAMWLLKRKTIEQYSKKKVSLRELLTDLCPIPFQAVDANLGQFKVSRATLAAVLEELKKTYGLYSFVRKGVLQVGLVYSGKPQQVDFDFQGNVVDSDGLAFQTEEDVKAKVKLISMQPDNTKIEFEAGDSDGEQRTLHSYNLPLAELKRIAADEIKKLRYSGYTGSFTAFGVPLVAHGDLCQVRDQKYPERAGNYLVKSVKSTFSEAGYRQQVGLDRKA